jgi:hypothetical protein
MSKTPDVQGAPISSSQMKCPRCNGTAVQNPQNRREPFVCHCGWKSSKQSLEQLSGTVEWRPLPSGTMRQIVAAYISSGDKSMTDIVAMFQARSMSPEKFSEIAEQILSTPSVIAVLELHSGKNSK